VISLAVFGFDDPHVRLAPVWSGLITRRIRGSRASEVGDGTGQKPEQARHY